MRLFLFIFNPFSPLSAQKNFLINIVLLIFVNVLVKPLYALKIDINIQLALGNARFGQVFALWSLAFLSLTVADLGIHQHNSSTVSKNNDYFYQQAANILKLKAILSFLYAIVVLSLGWLLRYEGAQLHLLFWLAFNLVCGSFIQWGRGNIAGLGYYKTDSFLSAFDKTLMIFTGWALLKGFCGLEISEFTFIWSQTVAFVITLFAVSGINLYLYFQRKDISTAKFEPFKMIKTCLPYALVVLLMGSYERMDTILLERWADDKAEAGYYSFAFRLLDLVNMVGVLFGGLLLNMFSRHLKDSKALRKLFWLAFVLLLLCYLGGLGFVLLFDNWLSHFLLGFYDSKSIYILTLLLISLVFKGIIHVAGTLLTAAGDLKRMNQLFAVAIGLNFSLNYFSIPALGAEGTAIVSIITHAGVAIVEMCWAWQWLSGRKGEEAIA